MKRIRLRFESIQQVVGSDELGIILLADEQRARALSVVCDELMTRQIIMRLQHPENCCRLLPEALAQMQEQPLEVMVYGLYEGQYQAVLADKEFRHHASIRMSDAVLLSITSQTPLYIEASLFQRQSQPFDEHATGVAIPINTMDVKRLNIALAAAIDQEDYHLASQLRDEINRRQN